MGERTDAREVAELRLAVTAEDHAAAVQFYRDVLGLPELATWTHEGASVVLLDAGRATMELIEPTYAEHIDDVEVGERVAGHVRVAFEVADVDGVTSRAAAAGARVIAEPRVTPWGSRNARLDRNTGSNVDTAARIPCRASSRSRPSAMMPGLLRIAVRIASCRLIGCAAPGSTASDRISAATNARVSASASARACSGDGAAARVGARPASAAPLGDVVRTVDARTATASAIAGIGSLRCFITAGDAVISSPAPRSPARCGRGRTARSNRTVEPHVGGPADRARPLRSPVRNCLSMQWNRP